MTDIIINTKDEQRTYRIVDVEQYSDEAPIIVRVRMTKRWKLNRAERMERAIRRVAEREEA